MKSFIYIALISLICVIAAVRCKKSSGLSGGGLGGNATLLITPEHHGQFVDTCEVYIKYGTLNAPSNGLYDDSASCVMSDTTPIAVFNHLTRGLYYIYGVGFHSLYTPPNVMGGVPVSVYTEDSNTVYLPTYTYYP